MSAKKKPLFTYYRFHAIVMAESMVPIIIYVMYRIGFISSYDKLSLLFGIAGYYGASLFIYRKFFAMEKKDEYVQACTARANRITLYTVLAVLFAAVLINDYGCKGLLNSDFCWLLVSGAMSVRSFIYMLLDTPSAEPEGAE